MERQLNYHAISEDHQMELLWTRHQVHQQELSTLRVLMMQGSVVRFGAQEDASKQVWQERVLFS